MKRRMAEHLQKCGKGQIQVEASAGTYMTRDMRSEQPLIQATTAAKDLAEKQGVDLTELDGSGRNGAVTVSDVKKAAKQED
jgi:pyruvate/2-oxoglutarate dehydrogenase complex dihydrolipoamide acyltransferase (E2) component